MAAALVSVVGALAEVAPVLVAINNLEWLDASSRGVVEFAARRLRGRVGVLATERTDNDTTTSWLQLAESVGIQRIRVGPMTSARLPP